LPFPAGRPYLYHRRVEWAGTEWAVVIGALCGGLAVAVVAALRAALIRRSSRIRRSARRSTGGSGPVDQVAASGPAGDPANMLARKSLDALRVGVVVLDPADGTVLANPSARAMGLMRAGPAPGSVAAHPFVRTLAGQVRRAGVRRQVEIDLPRTGASGVAAEPLGVLLHAVSLRGEYVAVEAADVTESHRVARVRRDFVANVSHELKTPIGALQLLAEALLDATTPADATARRFAERIQQEAGRLGRLVNDLLELSRVQGAEPLPAPAPVGVDALIAEVVDRARTPAAAKRITLTVTGRRGLTVYGSDAQLAAAVANLVENAVAYSPAGSEVLITIVDDGQWIEVKVIDHGIGIAAEDLDRIFERFYRADQARSRATGGTGLGLAIVKHIATNHGGRVEVVSTPGTGSTFTLRLPMRPLGATWMSSDPDQITGDRGAPADRGGPPAG
jgi:two-component system, OmpR family, sensor histidine kinase SenX3